MNNILAILRDFWPLFTLYAAVVIGSLWDLSKRRRTRYLPKWAWALVILFINTIGPVCYLVLGREQDGN